MATKWDKALAKVYGDGEEEQASVVVFTFEGGPQHGKEMKLCAEPGEYMRLAIPEWATYKLDAETQTYHYVGPEKPPKPPLKKRRARPWRPGKDPDAPVAGDEYLETEAWKRGVQHAQEVRGGQKL